MSLLKKIIGFFREIDYIRLCTIFLYFIFAIVFLAGIGVILPYIFDKVDNNRDIYKNLNQNLVTYFIAILVTSSLDYIMKIIDDKVSYKKMAILVTCILNTFILVISCYIIYQNNEGYHLHSIPWQIYLGIVAAYVTWWIVNYNSTSFNIEASLGGDPNKPLSNG